MTHNPRSMRARLRAAALNLLLLSGSLLSCALLAEGLFYVLNRQAPPPPDTSPVAEVAKFNRYHPILGHDGLPGVQGRFRRQTITHNAQGNRSPQVAFEKPAGMKRVVVLGDSQAWGYGVGDGETIGARLQQGLAAHGRWEAVNLGVSGYGTDQSFLKYLLQGRRYRPDQVVLVVFKNDLVENASTMAWGIEKPRFDLGPDGHLCLGNVPPRRAAGWPSASVLAEDAAGPQLHLPGFTLDLRSTQTWRFLRTREWRFALDRSSGEDWARLRAAVDCVENRKEYRGSGPEVFLALARRLQAVAAEDGARLTLLFVPRVRDVEEPAGAAYYDELKPALRAGGIAFLDLREAAAARAIPAARLFGEGDPHLSALGNALAAEVLLPRLTGSGE